MAFVRDLALVPASVRDDSTFAEAARVLASSRLGAIAVLDASGAVAGVFTSRDALRGLFPGYLGELHHTAFVEDDPERLAARAQVVGAEPVGQHLTEPPPPLDGAHSLTHAAERFLHSGLDALPVFEAGRFAGMLDQRTLADVADDLLDA
jgi:CBS domain-containing protein